MKKAGQLLILILGFSIEVSNGNTTQSSKCKRLCRSAHKCPTSEADWNSRKSEWKCDKEHHTYHCILTDEDVLCEVCLKPAFVAPERAGCPRIGCVNGSLELAPFGKCPISSAGCPNNTKGYMTDHLYKFPVCTPVKSTFVVESTATSPTERSSQQSSVQPPTSTGQTSHISTSKGPVVALCIFVVICFGMAVGALYMYYRRRRSHRKKIVKNTDFGTRDEEETAFVGEAEKKENDIMVHTFTKSLYATYVNEGQKWILRCKVNDATCECKWYKVVSDGGIHKKIPLEHNEEFGIRKDFTYRALEVLSVSDITEVYRCELPNGVYCDFALDPADTNIQTVNNGGPCEFVRSMDESLKECEWFKHETPIQSGRCSRFEKFVRGDDYVLKIRTVQTEDQTVSYRSKIGNEIQFYTLIISDETEQTDSLDISTSPEDVSNQQQHHVAQESSQDEGSPVAQRIIPFHADNITPLLDKIFNESDWGKFKTSTNEIVTLLEKICAHVTKEADQRSWFMCIVRDTIEKCRSTIHSVKLTLMSLRFTFHTFLSKPDPKGNEETFKQKIKGQLAILNANLNNCYTQMKTSIAKIVETTKYLNETRKSLETADNDEDSEKCRALLDKAIASMGLLHTQWQGSKQVLEELQNAITFLQTVTEHASKADYQTVASTADQIRVAVRIFWRMSANFESFYSVVDGHLVGFLNQCFSVAHESDVFANHSDTSTEYQAAYSQDRVETYSENKSPK